ncbi:MAG: hypothetical protein K2O34_07715 [Acetatifactor sp.]|nr:hypothetical protein [Acetatifactor sp.]
MRKSLKNAVFILLLLVLSASTALLAYLHFFASDDKGLLSDKNLSGEWTATVDMTEQAAFTALIWLQDIEAVSVSLEDMESYMQDLTIQVNLTLEQTELQTDSAEGTFCCNILPESYDACNQAAYEAFALAFQELLAERLHMAGYTGGTDREALEALVTETFGMSTVSYLMSCVPALLKYLKDLQTQYDGSGTYEAAEGILTRHFDAGGSVATKTEGYIREGSCLVLYEETDSASAGSVSDNYPMVYTLEQTQSQNLEK